jgi:hypothetical protein
MAVNDVAQTDNRACVLRHNAVNGRFGGRWVGGDLDAP